MFDKEIMWQSVSEAARVGIAGHIRPDGDCIGSCLAMYNYITENYGCSVTVYIEELPEKYGFLAACQSELPAAATVARIPCAGARFCLGRSRYVREKELVALLREV